MPPANVVFEPWVITPTQATINWTAFSDTVTPIDHVEYRVWRDIDTPVVQSTNVLTQSHTLNVTNFQGTVFAEVVVVDAQSNTTTRLTQFAVNNKVKPTPPDWLTFSNFTGVSVNVQWGAAYVSPTNASWRLYHRNTSNVVALLGTYPVAQLSATVFISTPTLNDLYVVGVDGDGLESASSPLLDFTPTAGGPTVAIAPWAVTPTTASTTFTVTAPLGLSSLAWTLKKAGAVVASGTAVDPVNLAVTNFEGTLELKVVATDTSFNVRQVVSTVQVWNVVPHPPVITVQAIGHNLIRLLVDKDPDDPATVPYADLTGLNLTLREAVPFVQTYTSLQPDTPYEFTARGVNPGGLLGPLTNPLVVQTYAAVNVLPPLPGALVPGPILSQLMTWLVGDLLNYFLQMATDTRIRSALSAQVVTRPVTLYPFLDMVEPVAADLGRIIREETQDQASYEASLLIDRAGDTVQKLSIFCERMVYTDIVNKAF